VQTFLSFGLNSTQDKLLCKAADQPLAGTDEKIPKHYPRTAIRCRIVGIRKGSRGQFATYARVVWLQMAVVSPANERAGECVERTRLICARALVKIARILMQERWQNGAANHNVGKAVSGARAQALTVALRTLNIVGDVCSLLDAGKPISPKEGNRIGGNF